MSSRTAAGEAQRSAKISFPTSTSFTGSIRQLTPRIVSPIPFSQKKCPMPTADLMVPNTRRARLRHPKVKRNISSLCHKPIRLDHQLHVCRLHGDHTSLKSNHHRCRHWRIATFVERFLLIGYPYFCRISSSNEPELTPMRIGIPLSLACRQHLAVSDSFEPMFPGLSLTFATPASTALESKNVIEVNVSHNGDSRLTHVSFIGQRLLCRSP